MYIFWRGMKPEDMIYVGRRNIQMKYARHVASISTTKVHPQFSSSFHTFYPKVLQVSR